MFFSVETTQIETYTQSVLQVVKYHAVLASVGPNDGSGWDAATNSFKCPYTGYYYFIVTMDKQQSTLNNHEAFLYMDNTVVTKMMNYVYNDATAFYSSTMSAITACQAGQYVTVKIWTYHPSGQLYSSSQHSNMFSGHLMRLGL